MCRPSSTLSSTDDQADIWAPVVRDGKQVPAVSTGEFLATAVMVPVMATTVLPLSIVYQLFRAATAPFRSKPDAPILDTGYVVNPKDVMIPREQRKYDLVILGATGFTGKLAVRHVAKTYGIHKSVKWAIAGRNQAKLDNVKSELAQELDMEDLNQLDTLIVDTSKPETMPGLVQNTRAVATTAGPFFKYGSAVVEFCAKFGTHYADITGETTWVQQMMALYEDTAKSTGAHIISLCGNDCVPWDLGVKLVTDKLKEETGEDIKSIVVNNDLLSSGSGGTMETLYAGVTGELIKAPKKNPMYAKANSPKSKVINQLPLSIFSTTHPRDGRKIYGGPFVMSLVNYECVKWSHALRGLPMCSYREYSAYPDFKTAFANYAGLGGFFIALLNPLTGSLVKKILPKPGEGPSMSDMEQKHFGVIHTTAVGTKGTQAESIVYFDKCTGYLETARMLTESALSMALQEKDLPEKEGGFYTPSVGLGDVLVDRLEKTGTYFASRIIRSKL